MILDDDDSSDASGTDPNGSVLRRLIRARNSMRAGDGETPSLPQTVAPTPARAGAIAAARAAERLYALPVQPLAVRPGAATVAELAELLPQPALFAVVQGPADALGVVALCPATVTALIEAQALGRVTARPMEKRRLTASDAMISADYVDRLLAELQVEVAPLQGFDCFAGFRYASHLDDVRPLLLLFEDVPFRTLDMALSFGGRDRREGRIFVAMPQRGAAALPAPRGQAASAGDRTPAPARAGRAEAPGAVDGAQPDRGGLGLAMLDAPVDIVGVLCRRRLTLGQLRGLVPGATITLPRVSLTDARVETGAGQLLAQGKLGEADGCFAIRLQDPAALIAAPDADAATLSAAAPMSPAGLPSVLRRAPRPDPLVEPPINDLQDSDGFRDIAAAAAAAPRPAGSDAATGQPLPRRALGGG